MKRKKTAKKKISAKKKSSPKKKVISKQSKKRQKKIYKLNELKKLAFKIDLRKLSKEQREYVKSIRREAKENYFKQKFTTYLLAGIEEYLSLFGSDVLSKFYEELKKQGISKRILNKIQAGEKISNKKYQAFMNYINNNFNNTELAFFWRIVNYMKENRGKISHKKIRQIINELYDFLNYIPDEFVDFADLDLYDYLSITSG